MSSLILRTANRGLVVLLVFLSLYVLLRGHNEPGGGFIGGLVAASAFALHAFASGVAASRRALRVDPRTLIGLGVLLAAGSGLVALVVGRPFLTGMWLPRAVPALGKVGTVLVFDIGVYLVVLGTTCLMLFTLDEEG